MKLTDREQLDLVRDRFTRTARSFAEFVLATRGNEAELLARMALDDQPEAQRFLALDLACGPGTFTRAVAARVRLTLALDLTPAMLAEAAQAAARAGLGNIGFGRADANGLPIADAALDLAVCGYSLHHFLRPEQPISEMARVVSAGGRVGIVDLIVPDGADADWNNRIEKARDASHARTLTIAEVRALLEASGLRVLATHIAERDRGFDEWMAIMGGLPGTPGYAETRRLMEASLPGDRAGFHPRYARREAAGGSPAVSSPTEELRYVQTSLFIVAEKR